MTSPRSQARRYAVLALYQWRLTGEDPLSIKLHMLDDPAWLAAIASSLSDSGEEESEDILARHFDFNLELLDQILGGVPEHLKEIDTQIATFLDRPLEQVDPVEMAILRLGTFEILFSPTVPDRVAINEAVELTKLLGAHEGHKYVNGVLDKIARRHAVASSKREP